tara:strand:- start:955 stop:1659 length:705 start_codon:yes stop_codon:yes gene_type:complete
MEALKENEIISKKSFIKHIFNFDSDSKNEMLNLFQYTLTSFVFVVILNKLFQIYIPEADESKHYATLIFEMLIQIIGLVLGMMIIHRIVSFIPTYSKIPYKQINMLNFVIPFLVILLSLQTKLGDKVNIIMESFSFLWKGKTPKPSQSNVKVSQPLSVGNVQQVNSGMSNVASLQTNQLLPQPGMANTNIPDLQQQINNGSNQGPAVGPSENIFPEGNDEPMAANAVLGLGSSF